MLNPSLTNNVVRIYFEWLSIILWVQTECVLNMGLGVLWRGVKHVW